MKLRKQLLLISLVTLALPWVGCQYIQEMESTLRAGQSQALLATAKAAAARFANDAELSSTIEALSPRGNLPSLFAHKLYSAPQVDGYNEEWLYEKLAPQAFVPAGQIPASATRPKPSSTHAPTVLLPPNRAKQSDYAILGRHQDELYVFINIANTERRYFDPSTASLEGSDYVLVHLKNDDGQRFTLALFASAPGDLKAVRVKTADSATTTSTPKTATTNNLIVDEKLIDHRVKGQWLGWPNQLEFTLPYSLANHGIALQLPNTVAPTKNLPPLVSRSMALEAELTIFTTDQIRLAIANNEEKMLAEAGNTWQQSEVRHGLVEWFYRMALRKTELPALDQPHQKGRFETQETARALQGESAFGWYSYGGKPLLRVATPIVSSAADSDSNPVNTNAAKANSVTGIIVAEQGSDTLASMTNSAFNRLLVYSFVLSCAAGLSLVLYATWLSIRIRRLSRAAVTAIGDSGKITEHFPVDNSKDELGELSRRYAELLTRLREYTNYLKTLSSKLSHELRTPLAIVRSSLDNLEHEQLPQQAKTYADRAREGTQRLSSILNAMSAASRVEQAIGVAEMEDVPCDQLLSNLKDAYVDIYPSAQITLTISTSDKAELTTKASGELLVQLLDKLIDNAADFCPEGGEISLGLRRDKNTLVFTVKNEGPELPRHMQGQLFDSMVSVREPQTTKDHHLGLGLYIVRLISDFHRGEVQGYNAADGSGVVFELRLPAL